MPKLLEFNDEVRLFVDALQKAGFTSTEIKRLRQSNNLLVMLRAVLAGTAKITVDTYVIDCNVEPFVPDGCSVKEHLKCKDLRWKPDCIELYPNNSNRCCHELVQDLASPDMIMNANVLDYLLAHPDLIPEEWKGKMVVFLGITYRNSLGGLFVRFICYDGKRWVWGYQWVGDKLEGCVALRKAA